LPVPFFSLLNPLRCHSRNIALLFFLDNVNPEACMLRRV
jgi:hypothetical protein